MAVSVLAIIVGRLVFPPHRAVPSPIEPDRSPGCRPDEGTGRASGREAASSRHFELDYGPDSVEKVEEILVKIYDQHRDSPLTEIALTRESLRYGVVTWAKSSEESAPAAGLSTLA